MTKDLNSLMPVTSAGGHYGVHEPENAWDGAGTAVTLYVLSVGDTILQVGWNDGATDQLKVRSRFRDHPGWSDWTSVTAPVPPEPPEPPEALGAAPVLQTLAPTTATIGSTDFTLRLLGQNFTAASVIVFNGGDEVTAFVSPTELTTGVKPSLVSAAISVPVLVRNADGQQSAALNFTFTPQSPGR